MVAEHIHNDERRNDREAKSERSEDELLSLVHFFNTHDSSKWSNYFSLSEMMFVSFDFVVFVSLSLLTSDRGRFPKCEVSYDVATLDGGVRDKNDESDFC